MKANRALFRMAICAGGLLIAGSAVYWVASADSRRTVRGLRKIGEVQDRIELKIKQEQRIGPLFTQAMYRKLKNGLTYKDAVAVLGVDGEELAASTQGGTNTRVYMWTNSDGSSIMLTFQDGLQISRAQSGLK